MTALAQLDKQKFLAKTCKTAIAIFFIILLAYLGTAAFGRGFASSSFAYFNHLADAFLHKRLYLIDPPSQHDLTFYKGQWYVPFPPLPAILMLPWVALRGANGVSTVIFSVIFSSANAALVYLLLQALSYRSWSRLHSTDNIWLTVLFAFSTVQWYMAPVGNVWLVAQICTLTFLTLAVCLALAYASPWPTSVMLGLAMVARPNVVLIWPLLFAIAAQRSLETSDRLDWNRLLWWSLKSALPILIAIAGLLWYNAARFGNPLDFGYLTQNVAAILHDDLRTYGQFNIHYIKRNLEAMLLMLPAWSSSCQRLVPDPRGMSLLLVTPALVFLIRAVRRSPLVVGAWVSVGSLVIPLLIYYNTGWRQFGYRFSLDFIIPLIILLAVAAREKIPTLMKVLIITGIGVNLIGVLWNAGIWCRSL